MPRLDSQELFVIGRVPAAALDAAEALDLEFNVLHFQLNVVLFAEHLAHGLVLNVLRCLAPLRQPAQPAGRADSGFSLNLGAFVILIFGPRRICLEGSELFCDCVQLSV